LPSPLGIVRAVRWCCPFDIGFGVIRNVQTAAYITEKALIRPYHHLIRALRAHLPLKGKAICARFHASAKSQMFCNQLPAIIPLCKAISNSGRQLRGARGFKRGEAPLPMEGFRETMGGFPAPFSPFVARQMAYISELSRGASYNEERKKALPIIRSRYQMGSTTSSVTCR